MSDLKRIRTCSPGKVINVATPPGRQVTVAVADEKTNQHYAWAKMRPRQLRDLAKALIAAAEKQEALAKAKGEA